jgi:hypothetical protein
MSVDVGRYPVESPEQIFESFGQEKRGSSALELSPGHPEIPAYLGQAVCQVYRHR